MDFRGVGLVWCLRKLSREVQRETFLLAVDAPLARAFRKYAWEFWPEGFDRDGSQGIWRLIAADARRDYFLVAYSVSCGDPVWGGAFHRAEVYPPPPITECGDPGDAVRFSYGPWEDDEVECDPPWQRYFRHPRV